MMMIINIYSRLSPPPDTIEWLTGPSGIIERGSLTADGRLCLCFYHHYCAPNNHRQLVSWRENKCAQRRPAKKRKPSGPRQFALVARLLDNSATQVNGRPARISGLASLISLLCVNPVRLICYCCFMARAPSALLLNNNTTRLVRMGGPRACAPGRARPTRIESISRSVSPRVSRPAARRTGDKRAAHSARHARWPRARAPRRAAARANRRQLARAM